MAAKSERLRTFEGLVDLFRHSYGREPSEEELKRIAQGMIAPPPVESPTAAPAPDESGAFAKMERRANADAERRVKARVRRDVREYARTAGKKPDAHTVAVLEAAARDEEGSSLRDQLGPKAVVDHSEWGSSNTRLGGDRRPRERHDAAPCFRIDPRTGERTQISGNTVSPTAKRPSTSVGRRQDEQARDREAVQDALRKAMIAGVDDSMSVAEIVAATGLSRVRAVHALTRLVSEGKVEETGNEPRLRYRLAPR